MDDSLINPLLLSSSVHLENVEQLLKTLEKQTIKTDHTAQSFSSSALTSDEPFLLMNDTSQCEHLSIDSGFTWDDQYDTRANYCFTFSTDKLGQMESKANITLNHKSLPLPLTPQVNNNHYSSPLNLSKISQDKSNTNCLSSVLSKSTNELTIHSYTDQAIQTSIVFESSSSTDCLQPINNQHRTISTNNHLLLPHPSSSNHKSLPDLSFISQYSKEMPRSHTTSPISGPTPPSIQQDSERPRTLKSIKRYKNSKHSTEPLAVFYSPQLRQTFTTLPTSPVIRGSDTMPTVIKMKLPPSLSIQQQPFYAASANSCDVQTILQNRTSPGSTLTIPETDCISSRRFLLSTLRTSQSSTNLIGNCFRENDLISPCHPTITLNDKLITDDDLTLIVRGNDEKRHRTYRYGDLRRCQTDIIAVDPVLHQHSFTDSPPNEFRLQEIDSTTVDDQFLMNNSHINIIPNVRPINESVTLLDNLVERIRDVIKSLFEIKRTDKAFFLNNEQNSQLDILLRNDLCSAIQSILEHGLKIQGKDSQTTKRVNLWKIIETSVNCGQVPQAYVEAKHNAQYVSSRWLYKFQAFIFALLNKSELINWLYYFTRQKELLQRYYQSPDALILVSISPTFNLFERMMTQLEKLTPLAFRLTYHPPTMSAAAMHEQFQTSIQSTNSSKSTARDWIMTLSRRTSKHLTQPIDPLVTNETLRSTLSRRLNALFVKTNAIQPRSPSSVDTTKSPAPSRRPRLSNVFTNTPVLVNESDTHSARRSVSPRTRITKPEIIATFQSKIPRPSLNVDKPKSVRYRSAAPTPK